MERMLRAVCEVTSEPTILVTTLTLPESPESTSRESDMYLDRRLCRCDNERKVYQKTYDGCLRQFCMKHLRCTGEPAITCFSCSPSTDTDGTDIGVL